MAKTWRMPVSLQRDFVHLYRKLLRETTYLPDALCRSYFRTRIVDRFRSFQSRQPARSPGRAGLSAATVHNDSGEHPALRPRPSRPSPVRVVQRPPAHRIESEVQAAQLHRKAVHTLRLLAAANDGAIKPLQRVLHLAYGRAGRQRHRLLAKHLESDASTNDTDLRELVAARETVKQAKARSEEPCIPTFPPTISVLAKAQIQQRELLEPQDVIKKFPLKVDALTRNGLPMPRGRMRHRLRVAYLKIIDKVLPPLPEAEWRRLKDLTMGLTVWSDGVSRRSRALGFSAADERPATFSDLTARMKRHHRPHQITPRFMRHRYEEILVQAPMLRRDKDTGALSVTWYQPPKPRPLPGISAANLAYFPAVPEPRSEKSMGNASSANG